MNSFARKVLIIVIFLAVMHYIYSQAFGANMVTDMGDYWKNLRKKYIGSDECANPNPTPSPQKSTQQQQKIPNLVDIGYTKTGNVIVQDFDNGDVKIQKSQQDGTIIKTYTYAEWLTVRNDIADYSTISKEFGGLPNQRTKKTAPK